MRLAKKGECIDVKSEGFGMKLTWQKPPAPSPAASKMIQSSLFVLLLVAIYFFI